MTLDLQLLRAILHFEEGYKTFPYDDATGKNVVGKGKISIGIGRNLEANPLEPEVINLIFEFDRDKAIELASKICDEFKIDKTDSVRFLALVLMVFQLGAKTTRTFQNTLKAWSSKDYVKARQNILHSLWHRQTPRRVQRLASMVETGDLPDEYKRIN